ncbi:MAG: response regulator transcription factor [Erysipelothrix sp.]|nr:response regulator transcription factor [Erysipelothrix sp.]
MQEMIGKHPLVDEFLCFDNVKSLLFELEDLSDTSAFLLDVEMPEINGLELAKELRKRQINLPLIFMTAYPEFALESYEVSAFDYLLKPISQDKVDSLLERLNSLVPQLEPVIFFQLEGLNRVYQKDIILCEAQGHYTRVVLEKHELLVKESISSIKDVRNY